MHRFQIENHNKLRASNLVHVDAHDADATEQAERP